MAVVVGPSSPLGLHCLTELPEFQKHRQLGAVDAVGARLISCGRRQLLLFCTVWRVRVERNYPWTNQQGFTDRLMLFTFQSQICKFYFSLSKD